MHQAVKPRGALGVVMGLVLERGNAAQNRATVEALDPPPGGSVLEIGFGPGHALEMLARRRPLGLIAGLDHSELMVTTARRRLDRGRGAAALDLKLGDAGDLPFPDEWFDLVYAVNSYHQWPDKPCALAEMVGVLKPGGEIVLSIRDFRTGGRFEPAGEGARTARAAVPQLEALGLTVETREVVHSRKRATFLVRGYKAVVAQRRSAGVHALR
ncbi:MAG: methyltransferase domain-containing protein [Phenylobacterium sp.]